MVALCVPWGTGCAGAPPSALERATLALEWSADHAEELGADPGKLVIAGRGAGAAAAAALSLRARDRGWPRVARQLLVLAPPRGVGRPECIDTRVDPRRPARRSLEPGTVAAATVVVAGEPSLVERRRRCSERLRALGAEVEELVGSGTSGGTGLADPLMTELAGSLRRALADSAETSSGDAHEDRR